MNENDWLKSIRIISKEGNVDIYMLSGGLNRPADDDVIKCVNSNRSQPNALLLLQVIPKPSEVG